MIAWLSGTVMSLDLESIVLNVAGVGYELACPVGTLSTLSVGRDSELFVYTHVREDQISLFGFATLLEKQVFSALLGVNGVGPKLAVKILSAAPVEAIAAAIENSDLAFLSKLPKVGPKTANQLVLSLKGKLATVLGASGRVAAGKGDTSMQGATAPEGGKGTGAVRSLSANMPVVSRFIGSRALTGYEIEILTALQNLGFRESELSDYLENVFSVAQTELDQGGDPVEAGLRWALRCLGGRT